MPQHDTIRKRRRTIALSLGFGILFAAYLTVGLLVIHTKAPDEQTFTPRSNLSGRPLDVYAELLSVNAVRDAVDLRLDFATDRDRLGVRFGVPADRDMVVEIGDGDSEQQVTWHRGQRMATLPLSFDLSTGNVEDYPFDRYTATLTVTAYEGTDAASGIPLPLQMTVWKRLPAWDIATTATQLQANPAAVALTFAIRRAPLPIVFATTIYCAMAVMAIISLSTGSLLFLRIRRMDTTMAAVLAAMIFTLPGLRGLMPGDPPLGVHGDHLVFFWAEISVVIGLALTVAAWAIGGDDR
ncbi:MAG: DUF4436 family protein [Acetobacteraceae bacterium]|jgi:Domain of unknown function (DUF4436)